MNKLDTFSFGYFIGMISFIIIHSLITRNNPEPIDVYRGKTTLEITYRDSLPIDSVVVFK